jgi:four helix bundle protein
VNRQSAILNTNKPKPKPMFLQLNHQKLDVFAIAKSFTLECYRFTKLLPSDERFNIVQQIRRAALSVCLNIAEGASRKSAAERKRYYEVARGSIIEIDAALDISAELKYCSKENLQSLGSFMQRTFSMLSKMLA